MVARLRSLAAAAAAVLMTGALAHGTVILAVDYNGQYGNGTDTTDGFTGIEYTQIASATIGAFTVTSNGTAVGGGAVASPPATTNTYQLMGDYLHANDTGYVQYAPLNIGIGGLAASTAYKLTMYSYCNWPYAENSTYSSIFYATGDVNQTVLGTVNMKSWGGNSASVNMPDFVTNPYSTTFVMTSDGTGTINVTCAGVLDVPDGNRTFAVVNGFTVDDAAGVPEPTSMALLGLGGMALLRRRR
jgi:hypothetical protein